MRKNTAIGLLAMLAILFNVTIQAHPPSWAKINGHDAHPSQVVVRISDHEGANRQLVENLLDGMGMEIISDIDFVPGTCVISVPTPANSNAEQQGDALKGFVNQLLATGLFDYAEPDYVYQAYREPTDAAYADGNLWGLNNDSATGVDLEAAAAWDLSVGSTDVIVGVLDTGVNYAHCELANQMWQNPNEIPDNRVDDDNNGWVDDVFGVNTVIETGDPLDDDGHGSHVAGTIGSEANGGGQTVGVAWNVRIMGLKVLGTRGGVSSDIAQGVAYAVEHGCHVINASLGGPTFSNAMFQVLAEAQSEGVVLIAAAGNEGLDNDVFPSYPANYNLENVISVAAMDRHGNLAEFSNFGINTVDIVAPGVDILSLDRTGCDYMTISGTSMAAPHVAGVAALILSVFPEASVSELRERLLLSAIPSSRFADRVATGGSVSALRALEAETDGFLEITVDPASGSAVALDSEVAVVARVSDLFGITDATVMATLEDGTVIELLNDGAAPDVLAGDALYSANIQMPAEGTEFSMTVRADAPDKVGIETSVRYTLIPVPENDPFNTATKLPADGAQLLSNNRFASNQSGEPDHAGLFSADASLWWTWSPRVSSEALVDTSGSAFDTVIAVYQGDRIRSLVPVASVNNVDGRRAGYLTFPAVAGETYRIAIAGATSSERGSIRLRVTPNGRPDLISPLLRINTPIGGTVTFDNTVEITGASFDPGPNTSGVANVFVRVNGEPIGRTAEGTTEWRSTVPLLTGSNTIEASAIDFAGNESSVSSVTVTKIDNDPPNDHFGNAEVITGTEGTVRGLSTRDATKEFGEPIHAANLGGASVWYRYVPEEDGLLDLLVQRATFDSLLAVYTGDRVSELDLVGGNDDRAPGNSDSELVVPVQAGQTYSIAIDGFGGVLGTAELRYTFTASALVPVSVTVDGDGSVTPGSGLVAAGSEIEFAAEAGPNFRFVGWSGSVESSDNPLALTLDSAADLVAHFESTVSDGFESGGLSPSLNYSDGGDAPWRVVDEGAATGQGALRSGEIGHRQSSELQLSTSLAGGVGSFDLSVSSEEGWDLLEFWINGDLIERWSGDVEWQTYQFLAPVGDATLVWRYVKDFSGSAGLDAAFLDNLRLPTGAEATAITKLSVNPIPGKGLKLSVDGLPGVAYQIESSTNLQDWTGFAEIVADADGKVQFNDAAFTERGHQFFRAVVR